MADSAVMSSPTNSGWRWCNSTIRQLGVSAVHGGALRPSALATRCAPLPSVENPRAVAHSRPVRGWYNNDDDNAFRKRAPRGARSQATPPSITRTHTDVRTHTRTDRTTTTTTTRYITAIIYALFFVCPSVYPCVYAHAFCVCVFTCVETRFVRTILSRRCFYRRPIRAPRHRRDRVRACRHSVSRRQYSSYLNRTARFSDGDTDDVLQPACSSSYHCARRMNRVARAQPPLRHTVVHVLVVRVPLRRSDL